MKQTNTQRIIERFEQFFTQEYLGLLQEKLDGTTSGEMAKSTMIYRGLHQWLASELEGLVSVEEVDEYLLGSAQTHGISFREFLKIKSKMGEVGRAELSAGGKKGEK